MPWESDPQHLVGPTPRADWSPPPSLLPPPQAKNVTVNVPTGIPFANFSLADTDHPAIWRQIRALVPVVHAAPPAVPQAGQGGARAHPFLRPPFPSLCQ